MPSPTLEVLAGESPALAQPSPAFGAAALVELTRRCLERDASLRFQSMSEVRERLSELSKRDASTVDASKIWIWVGGAVALAAIVAWVLVKAL